MNVMSQSKSEIGVGPRGEVAHVDLLEHSKKFAPTLYEIAPGVRHLVGVRSLANCTMIEGETGIILVDSGANIDDAEAFLVELRKVTDKPIKAVLYTHSHYTRGASAYIPEDDPGAVQDWGHEKVHQNFTRGRPEVFPTYVRRIATQMGSLAPQTGADASPNSGLGGEYHTSAGRFGHVKPTHTVSEDTEVVIDGVKIRLIPSVSDTDDCLTIWLPEQKVVVENIFWRVLPNFGAIRGEFYRRPTKWAESVEAIRQLEPEHILGCHGIPYSGKQQILDMLADYRDAIYFLYDQTIRGINQGHDADALAENLRLPEHLQSSPVLQEHYGEFAFGVRGVFNGVMGWFGTDTAVLHPVPRKVEAERIVAGFGGVEAVEAEARTWLENEDFAWSAQLSTYLLRLEPGRAEWRQLKADALRAMGQRSRSAITRNFYLVHARELEGAVDTFAVPHRTTNRILGEEPGFYVELLRYEIDPEKAEGFTGGFGLTFTDRDAAFRLDLSNSVLHVREARADEETERLELTFGTWAEILCGESTLDAAIANGEARISGDAATLRACLAVFDTPGLK